MINDKLLHIAVCSLVAVIAAVITYLADKCADKALTLAVVGCICALSIGIGKEFGDSVNPNDYWDWWDILADVVGMVVGAILIILMFKNL